jgi:hypothetical protein
VIPEITIKISFAQGPGASDESVAIASVGGAAIAPPELAGDPAMAQIPPPPASEAEAFGGDAADFEFAPPSLAASAKELPPPPTFEGEDTGVAGGDEDAPPPPL